jgi:hypothetical protein
VGIDFDLKDCFKFGFEKLFVISPSSDLEKLFNGLSKWFFNNHKLFYRLLYKLC